MTRVHFLVFVAVILLGVACAFEPSGGVLRAAPAADASPGVRSPTPAVADELVPAGETHVSLADVVQGVGLAGDVNFDCVVDLSDVVLVAGAWRAHAGDLTYKLAYDLNRDTIIDIRDIASTVARLNLKCSPLGVQMFGEWGDASARAKATIAGLTWVRLYVHWEWVEPANTTPDSFKWATVDNMVSAVESDGLIPLFTIQGPPEWAATRSDSEVPWCGPLNAAEDYAAFAEFLGALVERYDGDGGIDDMPGLLYPIHFFELYNEPDYDRELGAPGGCWGGIDLDGNGVNDQVDFANLLKAAYPAMKAADPGSNLIFGSIAYDKFRESHFNMDFTENVLSALDGDPNAAANGYYFDMMGFHQFDAFRDRWDGTLPFDQGILGKIANIQGVLGAHGLTKPLVSTEIGLQVTLGSLSPPEMEEAQARHLVHEYVRGMAGGLRVVIWYTLNDRPADLEYGLFDSSGSARPAYSALQVLAQQLGAATGWPATYETQLSEGDTGSALIQAYRFKMPDGTKKLVLWTDTGEKIKAQPDTPVDMCIDSNDLGVTAGEWTGQLKITDQYGGEIVVGSPGAPCVTYTIQQAAIYVEVAP